MHLNLLVLIKIIPRDIKVPETPFYVCLIPSVLFWGHYITLLPLGVQGTLKLLPGEDTTPCPFLGATWTLSLLPWDRFWGFSCWLWQFVSLLGPCVRSDRRRWYAGLFNSSARRTHTHPTDTRVHEGYDSVSGHHMTKTTRNGTTKPQHNTNASQHETTQQQNTNNRAVKGWQSKPVTCEMHKHSRQCYHP